MPADFFSFSKSATASHTPTSPPSASEGKSPTPSCIPPSADQEPPSVCGTWAQAPAAPPPPYQPQNAWSWGPWQSWSRENHRGFFEREGFFEGEDAARNRERFTQFRMQAGDTVAELSESALDALMTTVQAAKSKLADRRVPKESEEKS